MVERIHWLTIKELISQPKLLNIVMRGLLCLPRESWAYIQDSLPTTHSITADIKDVDAASENFDGITYAKGACRNN